MNKGMVEFLTCLSEAIHGTRLTIHKDWPEVDPNSLDYLLDWLYEEDKDILLERWANPNVEPTTPERKLKALHLICVMIVNMKDKTLVVPNGLNHYYPSVGDDIVSFVRKENFLVWRTYFSIRKAKPENN